ncbi:MAG TPA: nuclear transport factor 2 family protein [Nitrospira sp.]|nr:nuclear transport factor 2 family protein [Nitrospira sp.]
MKRLVFGLIGIAAALAASAAHADTSSASEVERNKELVSALFGIIYGTSTEDIAKIDDLVAADYVQHNPSVGQGREGLRQLLLRIVPGPKELSSQGTLSVKLIAEDDFVVRQELRTNGMLVDIFRIKDGKLQEHWDAFRFAPGAARIPGF